VHKAIFRKVSLDRLSSPEQLDQAMQVTSPRGWIQLGAMGLVLLVGVGWSMQGTLSTKVAGRGILLRSGGVLEVVAPASGRITDVAVAVGDSVTEGQTIAWLSQPELEDQVNQAREKLDALKHEHQQATRFAATDAELQLRSLQQQRSNLQQSIAASQVTLKDLEQRVAAQEELVSKGHLAKPTLLAARQQYDQFKETIRSDQAQLAQLAVRELEIRNKQTELSAAGEARIQQADAELAQLKRALRASAQVVSPYTGRILEVMSDQGGIVTRGEPVLSLVLTGRTIRDLVAIIYVPSIEGKLVKEGMTVHIAPSTVRQEEHGMMVGRVTFVSDHPATQKGMMRVLKNEQLVKELSGGDAPYEVHADLELDPATPSQYRWSSSKGPSTRIQSGTLATGLIIVESQRPIAKAIPLFRRWTGM